MLATMPMKIGDEQYYTMMEAADYLGYSTKTAGVAIKEYEAETGHEVRIKNGPARYISEKDLEAILIQRKPFEARRRGLVGDKE